VFVDEAIDDDSSSEQFESSDDEEFSQELHGDADDGDLNM
jgi:hypothetical protein